MSRLIVMYMFMSVMMVTVLGGTHYYLWARLIRDPAWGTPWQKMFTGILLTLALLIPVAMITSRAQGIGSNPLLITAAMIWLGIMFYLVFLVFGSDIVRFISFIVSKYTTSKTASIDPQRRIFISRLVAGGIATATAGIAAFALREGQKIPDVVTIPVKLKKFPKQLNGFSIAQLSDLHVGQPIRRAFLEEVVQRTNQLNPDMIVITGDLIDGHVPDLQYDVEPIKDLQAPHGVFFVTGNHEYYSGALQWVAYLEKIGINVLNNELVTITKDGYSFELAGVTDYSAGSILPDHQPDLAKACKNRNPDKELILLAHQPKEINNAVKHKVGLQLSGHTHGGQIWPFSFFVYLSQPFLSGLHTIEDTQIYVSRGTGLWGPPMRVAAPSEITHITLEAG